MRFYFLLPVLLAAVSAQSWKEYQEFVQQQLEDMDAPVEEQMMRKLMPAFAKMGGKEGVCLCPMVQGQLCMGMEFSMKEMAAMEECGVEVPSMENRSEDCCGAEM